MLSTYITNGLRWLINPYAFLVVNLVRVARQNTQVGGYSIKKGE
jgi:hypothetical protein